MEDRALWEVFYRALMAMAKAIKKYKLSGDDYKPLPLACDNDKVSTTVSVVFDE